ncbi:MAG: hypothetical protein ACJARS_000852, partial [bacterium]
RLFDPNDERIEMRELGPFSGLHDLGQVEETVLVWPAVASSPANHERPSVGVRSGRLCSVRVCGTALGDRSRPHCAAAESLLGRGVLFGGGVARCMNEKTVGSNRMARPASSYPVYRLCVDEGFPLEHPRTASLVVLLHRLCGVAAAPTGGEQAGDEERHQRPKRCG